MALKRWAGEAGIRYVDRRAACTVRESKLILNLKKLGLNLNPDSNLRSNTNFGLKLKVGREHEHEHEHKLHFTICLSLCGRLRNGRSSHCPAQQPLRKQKQKQKQKLLLLLLLLQDLCMR